MGLLAALTLRERRVLELAATGDTNVEIGFAMHISAETVKTHLKNLFWKLEAKNRAHAIAIGYRQGLLAADVPHIASAAMAPVSRALARHDWRAALEMLVEAGVSNQAAFEFVADEKERAVRRGRPPARDRASS